MTCVMSSQPLLAQETVNQSQAVQETIDQAGRQTQDRIDALSDKARAMLDEYRRAKDQAASLAVYNEQLAKQVDSQTEELEAAGYFAAIGHTPNVDFLDGQVELKQNGYIQWTTPFRTNTRRERLWFRPSWKHAAWLRWINCN